MAEVAAFPALARAKKVFLRRKETAQRREVEPNVDSRPIGHHRASSPNRPPDPAKQDPVHVARSETVRRCTASLVAFCSDFDKQLRLVGNDLLLLSTSVGREYQRESLALEKLTSELLSGEVSGVKTPPNDSRNEKRSRVRLRTRRPNIKLQVVFQSTAPKVPPPTSRRAGLLALQAVKACVLQSYARFYLYRCLYRQGPTQLVVAVQLATRCRRSRAFRQWFQVIVQRTKLRLRCRRAQERIERSTASWARRKAIAILDREGKYAVAKRFHQSRLLAASFHAWLGWYAEQPEGILSSHSPKTVKL